MRILIVSQYFWPENFRVNEIASELIARGHEVTILTSKPNYPNGTTFPEYRSNSQYFQRFCGAEVIRVPQIVRGSGGIRLILNYISFIISGVCIGAWKLRQRSFDAIFMFETSPITSALPAILQRRLKRAPLLMWVLDLWPETLSAVGVVHSPIILDQVGRLVKFIYRHCDRILIQSRAFSLSLQRYSDDTAKVRYFPQWAEAGVAENMTTARIAPEIGTDQSKFKILFAGNVGEAQDFPAILDAAYRLRGDPRLRWYILGDGRALNDVEAAIARLGLTERVILLGRHPLERMPEFFRAADALLVSLKDEPVFALTIPGKVQSYLAAGIPILAMINGEGRRVVEEAKAGLTCAAGDSVGLADAVRTIVGMSPDERHAMGESGKAYCSTHFDRSRLLDSLEIWLAEAASEYSGRQARRGHRSRP